MNESMKNKVNIEGVYEDDRGRSFVILRDSTSRVLPIWIGPCEAFSISLALEGKIIPRPMTHDLMKNMLELLEADIESILVDDLSEGTYYARLTLKANGRSLNIDARPSDAIALALRTSAPVFVAERVMQDVNKGKEQEGD